MQSFSNSHCDGPLHRTSNFMFVVLCSFSGKMDPHELDKLEIPPSTLVLALVVVL